MEGGNKTPRVPREQILANISDDSARILCCWMGYTQGYILELVEGRDPVLGVNGAGRESGKFSTRQCQSGAVLAKMIY